MAAKEWKESFATYLKRNYKEGEKVVFDTTSKEILDKLKSDEENKKGQYNPKDELIDKPRFRLREEMANDPNHLEFKVWLQIQVEDSSLGKKSDRILWREEGHGPEDEREQAIDALYRLGDDYLSKLLELKLFNVDTEFSKGKNLRQLFLIDLIYKWDKIEKYRKALPHDRRYAFDSQNIPWKDKKKVNIVDYVKDIKRLNILTGKSLMAWIYTDIIKVLIRDCKIKNEGEKNEFEIPGFQFLKNLSDELEKTINRYKSEVISIYYKNKDKIHLDDHDKKQIDILKSKGFTPLKNNRKTTDSKNTNISCLKLASNILNELLVKENDWLTLHQFLSKCGIFSSKAEVKKAIEDGDITVNGSLVEDISFEFNTNKKTVMYKNKELHLPTDMAKAIGPRSKTGSFRSKRSSVLNIKKMSALDYENNFSKADGSGATKNNAKSSYPHL